MEDTVKQILTIQNSSINWNEILTGLLVIITAIYVLLTYQIMKSTEKSVNIIQKQNEALLRPYISINVYPDKSANYYLKISNTGRSTATNLTLKNENKHFPHSSSTKSLSSVLDSF